MSGSPLASKTSDPFLIRSPPLQEQFWQPAVDFLIDTRSVDGTHPSAFGGCPWRGGTYYDAVIPALVFFYLADPEWVETMPRQIYWAADNLWDFRRYDLNSHWTIPKMNDLGGTLGMPAIATSASWVVEEPILKMRLEEIALSAVDHVFGRNPRLAAAPSRPHMGFPEIERGWPKEFRLDVCARLEMCRGSLSSAPGTEMFPFNPEGAHRHPEGWVNHGAAWCISLAYLHATADGAMPHPK